MPDDIKLDQIDVGRIVADRPISSKEDLLEVLRGAIAAGTLSLGAQLPNERELALATRLSRSSVRAALDRLVHEGRVIRHVGRGTFVIDTGTDSPSWADPASISPAEILASRALIEPTLPALIVMGASDSDLAVLMRFALEGRAVDGWRDAEFFDSHFHFLLYEATGNAVIKEIGRFVRRVRKGSAWRRIKEQRFNPERWSVYQHEHEEIASALVNRDAALAGRQLADHLSSVRRGMRQNGDSGRPG